MEESVTSCNGWSGKLWVDSGTPPSKPALLRRRCDEPQLFVEYDDPGGGGRVVVTETYEYHPDTQIKHITTHHRMGDIEELGTLTMRMYYPQELVALLKYNGFRIVNRWGDTDGHPYTQDRRALT